MKKNQNGFGGIEIVLIVVIVAVLGGLGFILYKNLNMQTKTTQANSTKENSSVKNTSTNETVDPYASWKQYCDRVTEYCFKYPEDWTLTPTERQALLMSPDNSVAVNFVNSYNKDGANNTFTTASIDDLNQTDLNLKIVGGVYSDDTYYAEYAVVNESAVSNANLIVGQDSQFLNTPRFDDPLSTSDGDIDFQAHTTVANSTNLNEMQSWLTADSSKTALLILKSLSHR